MTEQFITTILIFKILNQLNAILLKLLQHYLNWQQSNSWTWLQD